MSERHPEHFRESLPLFQQHIKEELCQSHAAKKQENLAAVRGPLLSVHGAEAARNTAIQQSAGHSTSITGAQSVDDRAHARKSDGPNSHWGYPLSSPSGLRSRRSELVTMGFVHEVGTGKTKSGRPCAIWALKERKA